MVNVVLVESECFMCLLIDIIFGMVGYWIKELCNGFVNIVYCEWFGKMFE